MTEIPLAACDRIIRNATNLRVGNDAAALMAKELEKIGEDIAAEAGKLAKHAKRKTVKASDIELALER